MHLRNMTKNAKDNSSTTSRTIFDIIPCLFINLWIPIIDFDTWSKRIRSCVEDVLKEYNLRDNFCFGWWKRTRLMAACRFKNFDRVQNLIINQRADVNFKGKLKNTALVEAFVGGDTEVIDFVKLHSSTNYSPQKGEEQFFSSNAAWDLENMCACECGLDDKKIAVGSSLGKIYIYNWVDGICENELRGHGDPVKNVCSLSQNRLASIACRDFTVKVWNIESTYCEFTLAGHIREIEYLSFDHGKLFSGSVDKTFRVWNIEGKVCEKICRRDLEYDDSADTRDRFYDPEYRINACVMNIVLDNDYI